MSDITRRRAPTRGAFTLFEIAIALLVMAIAVISIAGLFSAGLRSQQQARFRLLASAKAIDLVEAFNACTPINPTADIEGLDTWDSSTHYRAYAPDLECRLASHRFGVNPLPLEIARRLDSDDDEIARLIADGAYIYYSQPLATTSWEEGVVPQSPPSELRRLVFAFVGEAQANAIPSLAQKAWPYYVPYPSPPSHVHHAQPFMPSEPWPNAWFTTLGLPRCLLWERTCDPDVQTVFASVGGDGLEYGYLPYAAIPPATMTAANGLPAVRRYLQAALWYAQRIGLPATAVVGLTAPLDDFVPAVEPWRQTLAYRYLAHAATCLTRWRDLGQLQTGEVVPAAALGGQTMPAVTITHDLITRWHETCLALGARFAATYPYDWSVPRAAERPMMMDWPLIESDLFSPPHSAAIGGLSPTTTATMWKPVAAQDVERAGASMSYPGAPLTPALWGDTRHFTLAAPFTAAERCRELVFWSVDWQAYEDYETAPSAPVDASKWPRMAPSSAVPQFTDRLKPDRGGAEPSGLPWLDMHVYSYRNPEKVILFTRSMAGIATGANVTADLVLNQTDHNNAPDRDPTVFRGRYGADRDFDRRLGRGPLPATTRLRAVSVARFQVYDPRLPFTIR